VNLEDELLRHRVAIVVEVDADDNYLWIWAKTRRADKI
jgi:hypothetical protein